MLAGHPELLETRWDGRTALTEAVRWDDGNPCAKALIEAGADPNAARLDDPQFRPLRLALRSRVDVVVDLLQAGATVKGVYPGKYRSDSVPDLVLAATCCPQHIGALLAAGADPNECLESDGSALGHLLGQILKTPASPISRAAQWEGVRALVHAGATLRTAAKYHGPEWFRFWQLRFSNIPLPNDAPELFDQLQARMDDPGMRFNGQTFLHAIARELKYTGRGSRQIQAWEGMLDYYGRERVRDWLALDADTPEVMQTAFAELVPDFPRDAPLDCKGLLDALAWAQAFAHLGANPNETNRQGRTLARVVAYNWPWTVLLDDAVRDRVGALGLDVDGSLPGQASAIELFAAGAARLGVRGPEQGEIQALVLDAQSPAAAQKRRPHRL